MLDELEILVKKIELNISVGMKPSANQVTCPGSVYSGPVVVGIKPSANRYQPSGISYYPNR